MPSDDQYRPLSDEKLDIACAATQSQNVGRVLLHGLALVAYPVAGVFLLMANQGWVSHYSDKAWPLLLFCIGTPVVLAAATAATARLSPASTLLLLVTAAVGGIASIGVLLALAASAGSLS